MSDRPSSHSHSKSHSNSHSHSPSSDSGDSRRSSSHRHSHSHSDRSYSSSKSSKSYSRDSRSRSRDYSRGSSHGVGLPKIFITKLDPYVHTKDIEREFGKFGEIKKTNLKRGFAFVEYYNKEDAKEAIRKLNNKRLFSQDERVVVEEAKGKRRYRDRDRDKERDRERRRYSRSKERMRYRNRYRDRYYDDRDYDRYRYRRSDDYSRHRYRKTGPKSTDVCYNCGELGHWANECHLPKKPKKPCQSGSGYTGSQYSSNSFDHKAKKDYPDKKEKGNEPMPSSDNKAEPLKEPEKVKDVDPIKPKDN